ncbi:sortilin-related receptor-like [Ctenocephalides felis]|uniref:sortilin-related receptor-like n=1 Tax=Ctenocephalides felis TaxID=7515 RepID=UPI000E6E2213|nr:sortilin-related receptor-like [Ctenocephalides felis]
MTFSFVQINALNDSHQQMMVHWVGESSDVIICLSRDSTASKIQEKLGGNQSKLVPPSSSVYISYDYGDTFVNKTSMFALVNGSIASMDKYYTHPKFNAYFVFRDLYYKVLFVTRDMAGTFIRRDIPFTPSDLYFHPEDPETFLVHDEVDEQKTLYITRNFGETFTPLQKYVKSFAWSSGSSSDASNYSGGSRMTSPLPLLLYIERAEPTDTSTVLTVTALSQTNVLIGNVQDFLVRGDFMFATRKNNKNNLELLISYRRAPFVVAHFSSELSFLAIHVADVTDRRLMVVGVHGDTVAHLYVSESNEDFSRINFVLSLEGILCHVPNSTWTDTWLSDIAEESFADLYRVEGLLGCDTFDHGATWRPISPPRRDDDGHPIKCDTNLGCSLHLTQKFSQLYPVTRSVTILSSKSAPGIILAAGVIGRSLKGHPGVFLSRDGGLTWKQILKDYYFFNFGDHGGVLVAVKYFKTRGETKRLLYSTDEGDTWKSVDFHSKDLRIYGLMTEPGENTTVFTMFGSSPGLHQWQIIKVDLAAAFDRMCTPEDYKFWAPGGLSGVSEMACSMGSKDTYQRRIPRANCYNGKDYSRPVNKEVCECGAHDFECSPGFTRSSQPFHCIKKPELSEDPFAVPATCRPGQFYKRTKGLSHPLLSDNCSPWLCNYKLISTSDNLLSRSSSNR